MADRYTRKMKYKKRETGKKIKRIHKNAKTKRKFRDVSVEYAKYIENYMEE